MLAKFASALPAPAASSPATRWANIRRSPPPAASPWPMPPGCCSIRGRAMQRAIPVGTGAMAALLGLDSRRRSRLPRKPREGQVCQAANDNAPGQVVVSGAIDRRSSGRSRSPGRAAPSGRCCCRCRAPFHCALMQPAAEAMAEALAAVALKRPAVPVVANVTAAPLSDPAAIARRWSGRSRAWFAGARRSGILVARRTRSGRARRRQGAHGPGKTHRGSSPRGKSASPRLEAPRRSLRQPS